MRFYLAGQHNFGNRGCEALVRSILGIIGQQLPEATFYVPTYDRPRDGAQWPQIADAGGEFIDAPTFPPVIKWWNRIVTRAPAVIPMWEPRYTPTPAVTRALAKCDAVLMIGGDVISLDYGPGSLFMWSGLMDAAHRAGIPTMLFAASVGPFDASPAIERFMVNHLRRYSAITVRESESLSYLSRLGIDHATLVADPAFRLDPEPVDLGLPYDTAKDGVLAFNISPLVNESWSRKNPDGSLVAECGVFLKRILQETELSVALLPHVAPLDGSTHGSDTAFMAKLIDEIGDSSGRVAIVRDGLNAAQIKHVIGGSRFLIAARTHATIAGWSQQVPTISIAYSIKARGLNKDIFDTLDYLVDTSKVSRNSLWASYRLLAEREDSIRALLARRIPYYREKAAQNAEILAGILR